MTGVVTLCCGDESEPSVFEELKQPARPALRDCRR